MVLAACVALASLATGCGASGGDDGAKRLTLYVSVPQGGPAGADGRDIVDGARLALADAKGEAGGIAVQARYRDDAGDAGMRFDPALAAANAREASEDSTAIAYIGELDSGATRASLPITNRAGILQVSPGSGAGDLVRAERFNDAVPTEIQTNGERTFARLVPSDERQGEAGARLLRRAPGSGTLVLADGTGFASELLDGLRRELPGLAANAPEPAAPGADPCAPALTAARRIVAARGVGRPIARPRVYLATQPRCGSRVLHALEGRVASLTLIASDAMLPEPGLRALGASAKEARLTSAALDPGELPAAGRELDRRFERRYGRGPGRYAAYGYEAMASILAAIGRAGNATDRGSVVAAYLDGTERDSVIGTYSIDTQGETTQQRISAYRLTGPGQRLAPVLPAP